MMKKVAIIGAGLTGAAAASRLSQNGYQVCVFDKGRAAGGRMSSKRTQQGYLDMGAQYFTARSDVFKQQVQLWIDSGHSALWRCNTALLCKDEMGLSLKTSADNQCRFIGIPSMQSPVKALLQDIPLISSCRIQQLDYQQQSWTLVSEEGSGYTDFDLVLLTLPPAQTRQLLIQSALPDLVQAEANLLEPCWAVAMQAESAGEGDAIFCQHPQLRFISHQQHKTGRNPCYILHFNAQFSAAHLQEDAEFWFAQATSVLRQELNISGDIQPIAAHRWLYASQRDSAPRSGLIALPEKQLWVGGDWSYGGRVENAYLAGLDLADAVMKHHQQQQERA